MPDHLFKFHTYQKVTNMTLRSKAFHSILLNQMTAKAGIKKHGNLAIAALIKEIAHNLHEKDVIEGKNSQELTCEQRQQAL